ncbi:hypothetical protein [Paenibacillus rigui]|uniref:Uncharacterized protein n=1 Tax=Paenibacillus rigui TaxID=554312 RepID=A0A229UTZ2_9BACL|nr:hypothetical protein [Paenibacillus rigui]OXM86888.1 hypothetical protein CF651_08565 [Paenibacillus rigui]
MSEQSTNNVILFPKTAEFYQFELTRMLETERYGEAVRLLRFLISCQNQDERLLEEWHALLQWLQTMFPEALFEDDNAQEDEDWSEADMLREHLASKAKHDSGYAEKLLDMLSSPQSLENQLLALDQLALLEQSELDITSRLVDWITEREWHPLIQYKALQTLKLRGMTGLLELRKNGETILVHVEDTPSGFEEFPSIVNDIMDRVQEISQMNQPALAYFAQETWNEFLAFIYGTSSYRQMLRQDREYVDVWASALHLVLLERVFHSGDRAEILELYGITKTMEFQWEQAYRIMQQFAAVMFSHKLSD